ncbi:MAG: hypothetical protein GWN84_06600 [Gammaproteobacteria bacterium]|nr:hypothetical protein [Gammaproteobacteria bacterium]NIR82580.1 hypothetical protein [Gammaproteobacteria bacterium]NIR88783.1 hypothetical protein [Gammaproteobacteria bacterium]NIV73988.1 hypothetical protein [Gammaproteobacteria bacterium]
MPDPISVVTLGCEFPERLHPVSRLFLDAFLEGRMSAAEFQRFFSLPNSDYIPLAECLVRLFSG